MRNGRWKVRVCLMTVVLAAVIIGLFYYYSIERKIPEETGGVLVRKELGMDHGC